MTDTNPIQEHQIKLVAVGDGAVGKTCLLNVFVNAKFPDEYEPTVFENYEFDVQKMINIKEIDGQNAVAQLWDTAGQEGFERIRILSYENTNCFILCFSCADLVTFNNVDTKWLDEIRKNRPEAKILLVGTKADLRSKPGERGSRLSSSRGKSMRQKEVQEKKIEDFVRKQKIDGYVECSAMTDTESVKKVFEKACKLGLTQVSGIMIEDDPADTVDAKPDDGKCPCTIA
jgi:small GTP-binding protein